MGRSADPTVPDAPKTAILMLLPGRSGYRVRRVMPEPFSLGEHEEVKVVIENSAAAGLLATIADHAPADLTPQPREVAGRFDRNGRLELTYSTTSPRRGAYRFGPVDLQVSRRDGWWRRQVRLQHPNEVAVFPNVVAIKRMQLTLRRGLRVMAGLRRARPPGASTAFAGLRDYVRGDDIRRVSWTATARRDHPVVVEVEAERGQQVMIAIDCGRLMTAPAGQLWSTVEDLCRWAAFLVNGNDDVLAADVVEAMWFPQVMYYPDDWVLGWGLGLQLHNQHGAIYGGHGGAMAGHLAGVFIDRKTKTGAASLTNSGTRSMPLSAPNR